jgi:tetratricopeptide (TPR) repeat protein
MPNSTLSRYLPRLAWLGLVASVAMAGQPPDWEALVVKLEAQHRNGGLELASAVPLGGDYLVTNCHAVQKVRSIRIVDGKSRRPAELLNGDDFRDLCYLKAPGLQAPALPVASEAALRVGMTVYAAGYTNGRFAIHPGRIIGLHSCSCANGRVIQTSAPFDRGASGGGLFDGQGRLLGILTFRAPAGGNYHFALPAGWLNTGAGSSRAAPRSDRTFWQQGGGSRRAYFLTACALGAQRNWPALNALATEWTDHEQDNPEAWMARGRASLGLGDPEAAAAAFKQALAIDPSHDTAIWELQLLEFDLDRDLLPR